MFSAVSDCYIIWSDRHQRVIGKAIDHVAWGCVYYYYYYYYCCCWLCIRYIS